MEYDPIKNKLAYWLEVIPGLRSVLFTALDLLLLRQRYVKREIKRWLPHKKNLAFYDAGAGFCQFSWFVLNHWPSVKVLAIDLKTDYLDSFSLYSKKKMGDRFTSSQGDLQIYRPQGRYDMAVAIDILEHIPDDRAVMKNIHDALVPQGILIISTPSDTDPAAKFTSEHVRPGYNKQQLENKLMETGFHIEDSYFTYGRFGHLAWLLMMKYPMSLIQNKLWLLLLPYYALAYPISEFLMRMDMDVQNTSGTGIIIVAKRTQM